jgi:hypothetical protein
VALPIPRDKKQAMKVAQDCKRIIEMRIQLRDEATSLVASIASVAASAVDADSL